MTAPMIPPEGDPLGAASSAVEVIEQSLRLADHLRTRVADALREAGVNESRLAVLRHISAGAGAGCSQIELAAALGQAESSVCTLVERMRNDGLIDRGRSQRDRRKSVLLLTPTGQGILTTALSKYADAAGALSHVWADGRLERLRDVQEAALFELERPRRSQPSPDAASSVQPDTRPESNSFAEAA